MFVILNNVYCIPTYVVWMVIIFPLKRYHPDLYWKIEGHFFHWLLAMVSMWSWSAGYDSKYESLQVYVDWYCTVFKSTAVQGLRFSKQWLWRVLSYGI
jgi:hypothetical protein